MSTPRGIGPLAGIDLARPCCNAAPNMKLAVITDDGKVPRFGLEALDAIRGCDEFTLFSCTNTRMRKRVLKHAFYYALNLFTIRNRLTRFVDAAGGRKRVARTVRFASDYEGAWQVLPEHVVAELAAGGFDAVLKLGMGLLRVPPPERLSTPILSFHHGDPDLYRGRPAGFWEMLAGDPVMGQMVQAIGNRLDAGAVLAYAETKIYPWSYRRTLLDAYRHSPLLIEEAIANARAGRILSKPCKGTNYRLPSNLQVLRFIGKMAFRLARRLLYGAFTEKKWSVSLAPAEEARRGDLLGGRVFPEPASWRTLKAGREYVFYADPFFSVDPPGLLVEALRASTGRGEIVLIEKEAHRLVSHGSGHLSYPSTIELDGRQWILPEIASWSPPKLFTLEAGALREAATLEIEGAPHLLDPTLVAHQGRLYLFGNDRALGPDALFLWVSEGLGQPFRRHPASPILISPAGGRMGGSLAVVDGSMVRLGQDSRTGYGDGVIAFAVEALGPEEYRERRIGGIRFRDRRGPHTLNLRPGEIVFDWYEERFTPLAGVRRLFARRSS